MKIYGIPTCDTCRKARKALPEAEFVDVRAEPMSAALLTQALETFGDKILNTRSTTWRGLDEQTRKMDPLELLRAHPTLMKRPLIAAVDGSLSLGWDAATRAALGVA